MNHQVEEFVYRLPGTSFGSRPGAHHSRSRGQGMSFAAHARLFDLPDPRRLDLRASINNVHGDWLVKTYQQPASINIYVLADISASMQFGNPGKVQIIAQFLDSLGISAHRYADAVSLLPFDTIFREDLYLSAMRGGALGSRMAQAVLNANTALPRTSRSPFTKSASLFRRSKNRNSASSQQASTTPNALMQAVSRIEGKSGLVFLLSDFHWPLHLLKPVLDKLSSAAFVPIVIWDKAEVLPPEAGQVLFARGINNGKKRQLWLSGKNRETWQKNVEQRRQSLIRNFMNNDFSPFFIEDGFDAEAVSRYFIQGSL